MNDAKAELGRRILAIKQQRKLSWAEIAADLGYSSTWTCAACLGQMSMTPETAEKAARLFGLDEAETALLQAIPYRGSLPARCRPTR
jgi:cyanate lyase